MKLIPSVAKFSQTQISISLRALALGSVVLAAGISLSTVSAQQPTEKRTARASSTSTPVSTSHWADSVWSNSMAGRTDAVVDRLKQLPEEHVDPDVMRLTKMVDGLFANLDAQIDARVKAYNTAITDLATHLAEENYRDALADALTAHEMGLTYTELAASHPRANELRLRDAILQSPQVVGVIQESEKAARRAERTGQWLTAQDYYYRLNALMNMDQRYENDLARASRRIKLLSVYAPARLREITNRYLEAIGEDARPDGEAENRMSWEEKVVGIDRRMAVEALSAAATSHLWAKGWEPLVTGGLDALDTVLTTSDLAEVFPGLERENLRKSMLKSIQAEKAKWRSASRHDRFGAMTVLRHLQEFNEQTVLLPEEVLFREFVEGGMTSLDKFSSMIWPDEMSMFSRQLNGMYVGVGIQISLDDAYRIKVVTPLEDSPAMQAGMRAGDVITAVDGKSTLGISLTRAVSTITGNPATDVTLTVRREGVDEALDFTVRRSAIKINTIKGWRRLEGNKDWDYLIDPINRIGYIRLVQQFGPSTVSDFDRAMRQLQKQGVQSLILDLRFNPGGLLNQAVDLCNRFVESGLIVETVDPTNRSEKFTARRSRASALKDMPVVVLINEGAASASEIVAGCLKDHNRALLIGARTYGKGSVQKVRRIAGDQARLRLTSEKYLLPSGKSIHRQPGSPEWGVDPDLSVQMTPEQIADTILLRQECDIIFDPNEAAPTGAIVAKRRSKDDAEDAATDAPTQTVDRNPDRLIYEPGYDLQLQTALVILQSLELPDKARHAVLEGG